MQSWARFVVATYYIWIPAWLIVGLAIWIHAPNIPTLLADDDTGFLPADAPSTQALAKLKEEFPGHAPASRAAIIFVRETGLTSADRTAIDGIAQALLARSGELGWHVHAASTASYLEGLLESRNGQAAVIAVDLPAEFLTHSTVRRVRIIREVVSAQRSSIDSGTVAQGLEIEITGNGALGELLDANTKRDVDRTTMWAFAGVTSILLLIYRSPVALLLPLVTIALSLMVTLGLLGWAAAAGWPINGLVEMFIIVILAGTGVDYCLFLFARFREERTHGLTVSEAVETAVGRTGGAILASAGTNAVGLATLALARNRDLYTSGPTIAFAICTATFAVLTLTPSLMRLVGKHLTHPARRRSTDPSPGRKRRVGQPCAGAWGSDAQRTCANDDLGGPVAANAQREHDGGVWSAIARLATDAPGSVTLVLMFLLLPLAVVGWRVKPLYDAYEEYPAESSFVRGARLYEKHFLNSAGVSEQTIIVSASEPLHLPEHMSALRISIGAISAALQAQFPIAYQRDLTHPLGRVPAVQPPRQADAVERFTANVIKQASGAFYVGESGRAIRIDLGLRIEPRSAGAMDTVPRIRAVVRQALDNSGLAEALGGATLQVDIAGDTPLYADIRDIRTRDFRIVAVVAIGSIYLILIALIRSPVRSAILVIATILTYLATYGATWVLFTCLYGLRSVSYQLDFLLFIIILSLGQDYNIYVVTRIREELTGKAIGPAVRAAVSKTGPVVSSCGIIMATAFASMYAGSLIIMKEFAVALAMGILIDTFLVRPLLVPALILLGEKGGKRCQDEFLFPDIVTGL